MGAPLNGSNNTAPKSETILALARDCLDASQIPYSGFVLSCPEAREQFYASRHHMVHRRYVGIRSFGADSVFG